MKLNEKLVSLRKAQKLNQAQAAEALNVSRQAISTWETGAVLPSTDSLKALSRLYQVPVDHLLNDDMDLPQALVTEKEGRETRRIALGIRTCEYKQENNQPKQAKSNHVDLSAYHSLGRCDCCCGNIVRPLGKGTQGH